MPILEIDSVQFEIGNQRILSDIYLRCETGKITGILGRNGAGKSCLMQIIFGSMKANKSIRIDSEALIPKLLTPNKIAYLPQFNIIPQNLSIKGAFTHFNQEFSVFANQFIEFKDRENTRIGSLSGGARRLIELYLLLKSKGPFILLDEPFTHLSPVQIEKVMELIIQEKKNKGIIITDHLYKYILELSDSLYILKEGKTYWIKDRIDLEKHGYLNPLIKD